eukprot:2042888-Prymnesium_polylepis.1
MARAPIRGGSARLHAEDGEDVEEDDRLEQQGHREAHASEARDEPERPQHAKDAQHAEGGRARAEHRHDGGAHDEAIELVPRGREVGVGRPEQAHVHDLREHLEHEDGGGGDVDAVQRGGEGRVGRKVARVEAHRQAGQDDEPDDEVVKGERAGGPAKPKAQQPPRPQPHGVHGPQQAERILAPPLPQPRGAVEEQQWAVAAQPPHARHPTAAAAHERRTAAGRRRVVRRHARRRLGGAVCSCELLLEGAATAAATAR